MKKQKIIYSLLFLFFMISSCDEQPSEESVDSNFSFLVGTYTDTQDQGIELLSFDPINMVLQSEVIAKGVKNPSFIVANKDRNLVFAVEETSGDDGGKVKSFRFDPETGDLDLISSADTYGDSPCYLTLDPSEKFLVVGNYTGGNLSVFSIQEGNLTHVQTIQHEGNSIIESRQEKPHVHSAKFHPNGKQLFVGDLGTDKIFIYNFNPDYAVPFAPANPAYYEVEAGSGPRHLAVHPKGNQLYLVHELTAELGVYNYSDGVLSHTQVLSLTDANFSGSVGAAEVRISDDANFVYVSNRGDANEISVFEVGKDNRLNFVQRISTGGKTPRNFIMSPDGDFLLVANQDSNEVRLFKRDGKTGKLSQTDVSVAIHKPVYFYSLR